MRKSMKKRMLCLLMTAVMVVLATGCGGKSTQENPTQIGRASCRERVLSHV